jgi:hypothetical protein
MTFTVSVVPYKESCGTSYHVVLINNDTRPAGTSPFDDTGRIVPFHSADESHARHEAKEWAQFLGVPEQAQCDCIMCRPRIIRRKVATQFPQLAGEQDENS